jgi:hypothetical protein
MNSLPSPSEVLAHLVALIGANHNPDARRIASDWATPILIDAGTPLITDSPVLGRALFLLGAADLLGDFENFVYGPADFEEVKNELDKGDIRSP